MNYIKYSYFRMRTDYIILSLRANPLRVTNRL
nr:MAG TPA: hypothetical protein [Caudoviricetes sp.]